MDVDVFKKESAKEISGGSFPTIKTSTWFEIVSSYENSPNVGNICGTVRGWFRGNRYVGRLRNYIRNCFSLNFPFLQRSFQISASSPLTSLVISGRFSSLNWEICMHIFRVIFTLFQISRIFLKILDLSKIRLFIKDWSEGKHGKEKRREEKQRKEVAYNFNLAF